MKLFVSSVLFLGFIVITVQDIGGRKGCDCSICKGVDNKLNPVVGKKAGGDVGGKSSCNICEKRKEMLRMEREKQEKLKKCPFDILGSPAAIKGITSEEIFDEFREQIVPSQNGFFDGLMRGIVKTMHVSSVAELKWAKEKEIKELAKKMREEEEARKKKQEEEAKQRREAASDFQNQEIVSLNNPVPPKVTVVLKQTPCGQVLAPSEDSQPERISLTKRLPKEAEKVSEDEIAGYPLDYQTLRDYSDLSNNDLLQPNLIDQLIGYNMLSTVEPQNQETETIKEVGENYLSTLQEEINHLESSTESPFVKFVSDEELKALSSGRNSVDDIYVGLNVLPTNMGIDIQKADAENDQKINYSIDPVL